MTSCVSWKWSWSMASLSTGWTGPGLFWPTPRSFLVRRWIDWNARRLIFLPMMKLIRKKKHEDRKALQPWSGPQGLGGLFESESGLQGAAKESLQPFQD